MKLRFVLLVCLGVFGPWGAASATSTVLSGGLTQSIACPSGSSPCSTAADFTLDPPTAPATGTIALGANTAVITLNVASYSMSGAFGGVSALDFSNVSYSATVSIIVQNLGGGIVQIDQQPGFANGSVSGTYAQTGGPGAAPFNDASVSFSNLSCLLVNGEGQCGFNVGSFAASADFSLSIDSVPGSHDVVQTFNVVVPEPGTAGLLGLGLLGLGLALRRR